MATDKSNADISSSDVNNSSTGSTRANPIDLEAEDSDSSTDIVPSSGVRWKRSHRKLTEANTRFRRNQEQKQASVARRRNQERQIEREVRSNRVADRFAKTQTVLIDLGSKRNIAADITRANQRTKEQVNQRKRLDQQPQATSAHQQPHNKHDREDHGDQQAMTGPGPNSGRRADGLPSRKKKARHSSVSTVLGENDLAPGLFESSQIGAQPGSSDSLIPPATPSLAAGPLNDFHQPVRGAMQQAIPYLVVLREGVDIDFSAVIDMTTEQSLSRTKALFRYLDDPVDILPSFRKVLEQDFVKLHRMHKLDMERLFPHSLATQVQNIVSIKCLRGYLKKFSPQTNKFEGVEHTCRTCCEQNYFCYAIVQARFAGSKMGMLAVLLPLGPKRRASEVSADQEAFYCRGGDLVMDGLLGWENILKVDKRPKARESVVCK